MKAATLSLLFSLFLLPSCSSYEGQVIRKIHEPKTIISRLFHHPVGGRKIVKKVVSVTKARWFLVIKTEKLIKKCEVSQKIYNETKLFQQYSYQTLW